MDPVDEWIAADQRWIDDSHALLEVVFKWFIESGEWPEIGPLRRLLFQTGVKTIDVQAVANAKPTPPGQLATAIRDRIVLNTRHLLQMPAAANLLDMLVVA